MTCFLLVWVRLSGARKRIMPWIPVTIMLRDFYHSLFSWCKQSLDIIAKENFLDCSEEKALVIINSLSGFFYYDHGVDVILDRLSSIERIIDDVYLKEVKKPKP